MKIGFKEVFGQGRKSLLTSAGLSITLFSYQAYSLTFDNALLSRQLLLSALLFLSTFLALRLFAHLVARSVEYQTSQRDAVVFPSTLRSLVVFKELVKCVVGLSLTLVWAAGLLSISETFVNSLPIITVGVGSGFSLLLFFVAYLFVLFADWIPCLLND
jgi:hypothetical protein